MSVQIESDSYLKTRKESLNWLKRLTSSNGLGSIYVVNQVFSNLVTVKLLLTPLIIIIIAYFCFVFVFQSDIEKVNNVRYAFEDQTSKTVATPFVCISSKGENNCAELKSLGFNALNVSWDGKSSKQNHTSNLLLSLDTLLQKSCTTGSSSFVCSEQDAQKSTCKFFNHKIDTPLDNVASTRAGISVHSHGIEQLLFCIYIYKIACLNC